jgi:hypothetical protein
LAKFLGDLACDRDVPEAQANGLARRALDTGRPQIFWRGEPDRFWPGLFATRIIGPDCPPAKGLPDNLRRLLERLAARA